MRNKPSFRDLLRERFKDRSEQTPNSRPLSRLKKTPEEREARRERMRGFLTRLARLGGIIAGQMFGTRMIGGAIALTIVGYALKLFLTK